MIIQVLEEEGIFCYYLPVAATRREGPILTERERRLEKLAQVLTESDDPRSGA
jgi:hypothetical protein